MTIQILNDFHGDGVFRDQQGTIWVRQAEMVDGMARAWDEGYEAAAEFHEGREKGHWENDFPTKGMRTWRPDPAPTSPYRAAKGGQ